MQDHETHRTGSRPALLAMTTPSSRGDTGGQARGGSVPLGRAAALRALPLFEDASADDIERLAFASTTRRLEKGRRLASASPGDDVAILLRGRAKRIVPRGQAAGELLLELYDGGDFVSDARSQAAYTDFAGETVAIEASTVLLLPRAAFDRVLTGNPPVALRLLELFASRIARLSALAAQNSCMDAGDRLYCRLVELSRKRGRRDADGLLIEHGLPQRELAAFCAASREIVNRQLAAWRARGWVEPRRQSVMVHDEAALTHAVGPDARRVGFGAGDGRSAFRSR